MHGDANVVLRDANAIMSQSNEQETEQEWGRQVGTRDGFGSGSINQACPERGSESEFEKSGLGQGLLLDWLRTYLTASP